MTDALAGLLKSGDAPGDLAYDGSDEPQARVLTARERDVLCRIISDIFGEIRRTGKTDCVPIRMGSQYDVDRLAEISRVINPRERCLCNVGAQECPVHPGNTWDQERKVAFRKEWDARVVKDESP